MMLNMFKIFAEKKPSGRVEVTQVVPLIVPEDKDSLFTKAVKKAAFQDLKEQIKYNLDCIAYGKDRVDQTIEANKLMISSKLDSDEILKQYPKAFREGLRGFYLGENHSRLAWVLAENWINENYQANRLREKMEVGTDNTSFKLN